VWGFFFLPPGSSFLKSFLRGRTDISPGEAISLLREAC